MEVTERDALEYSALKEGSVEEATSLGSGGGVGTHLQGIQCLPAPPGDGELLPITGADDIGGGQLMVGGGQ